MEPSDDPDQLALLYVQQYLAEHDFRDALSALEAACGLTYDDSKLPEASRLMRLVWKHVEESAAAEAAEAGDGSAQRAVELEALLRGSKDDYCREEVACIEHGHGGNVICVCFLPRAEGQPRKQGLLLTGSGDGCVHLVSFPDGDVKWSTKVGGGGVLSVALRPAVSAASAGAAAAAAAADQDTQQQQQQQQQTLLAAVGSMDGSVTVIDVTSGEVVAAAKPHAKYVVRVTWSPDGALVASGSWDQSMALLRFTPAGSGADGGSSGGGGGAPAGAAAALTLVTRQSYQSAVQDVTFLHSSSSSSSSTAVGTSSSNESNGGGATLARPATGPASAQQPPPPPLPSPLQQQQQQLLVVALRDTNYLRLFDATFCREASKVNMNVERGDDHVSFSAKALAPSPCGRYLLIATDKPRVLLLRTADWTCLNNLYDLPVDPFHQPSAAWHPDTCYVYVAAADARVHVYHVGSGRVVARLAGHKANVRGLCYDHAGCAPLLATCGFDKTVRLWGSASGGSC